MEQNKTLWVWKRLGSKPICQSQILAIEQIITHLINFNMMLRTTNIFVHKGIFCACGHAGSVKRSMFIELMPRFAMPVQ
jgi:hypothetical protein